MAFVEPVVLQDRGVRLEPLAPDDALALLGRLLAAPVAQVLAYVYRLKAALRGEAPMPGEPPQPQVPIELDPLHTTAQARP